MGINKKSGFTLVEMAIVLVIIGLVIGAVLVGRDLIHGAEIRATVSQFQKYDTAANTFRLKFGSLPGDIQNANDFGFDPTSNGNGDGYIGYCNSSSGCVFSAPGGSIEHEYVDFWYQLSFANLIPDHLVTAANADMFGPLGVATPPAKIKAPFFAASSGWAIVSDITPDPLFPPFGVTLPPHSFLLGSVMQVYFGTLYAYYPADMAAIDAKIDDGLPMTGKVSAFQQANIQGAGNKKIQLKILATGVGGSSAAFCVRNDTTPIQYNVQYTGSNQMGFCAIAIKASF